MRPAALALASILAVAAACGYATAPSQSTAFALAAGNYTLKISGSGTCSSGTIEGSSPVTVAVSGTSWTIRSVQASDSFAMSLTTDGAVVGAARGDISGSISTAPGAAMMPAGTITGTNSAPNVAGGPIVSSVAGASPIQFIVPTGGGFCLAATWTLTPR